MMMDYDNGAYIVDAEESKSRNAKVNGPQFTVIDRYGNVYAQCYNSYDADRKLLEIISYEE